MSVSVRAAWRFVAVLAGVGLWAAPVHGGQGLPDFTMTWDASNDLLPAMTYNLDTGYGSDPVYGTHHVAGYEGTWEGWNYAGSIDTGAWAMEFEIVFSGESQSTVAAGDASPIIVSANLAVANFDVNVQNFTLLMQLPVGVPIVNPKIAGSISGGLTANSDGGTASAPIGASIYTALIDSVEEHQLMVDPFSEDAQPYGSTAFSESFGSSAPVGASRNVDSEISLFLNIDLTPGDTASISSVFAVYVPGPGALPAIAMLGLAGRRRRRGADTACA